MASKNAQNAFLQPTYKSNFTSWSFEEKHEPARALELFGEHSYMPFLFAIVLYLPILYIGQLIMLKREAYNLKVPLMLWNGGLAIFSMIGFSRIFPEMLYTLNNSGFYQSVCDNSFLYIKQVSFWVCLFTLSKIPELGDTLFLVLRKQKLLFLHVYHHSTVLIYSWFVMMNRIGGARWFCSMNYGVHSIMYTYYVLKAIPILRIPRWVSMIITSLQTIQMIMGTCVIVASTYYSVSGYECANSTPMALFGIIIYGSFLVLFAHFFYNAYCTQKPSTTDKKRN